MLNLRQLQFNKIYFWNVHFFCGSKKKCGYQINVGFRL